VARRSAAQRDTRHMTRVSIGRSASACTDSLLTRTRGRLGRGPCSSGGSVVSHEPSLREPPPARSLELTRDSYGHVRRLAAPTTRPPAPLGITPLRCPAVPQGISRARISIPFRAEAASIRRLHKPPRYLLAILPGKLAVSANLRKSRAEKCQTPG